MCDTDNLMFILCAVDYQNVSSFGCRDLSWQQRIRMENNNTGAALYGQPLRKENLLESECIRKRYYIRVVKGVFQKILVTSALNYFGQYEFFKILAREKISSHNNVTHNGSASHIIKLNNTNSSHLFTILFIIICVQFRIRVTLIVLCFTYVLCYNVTISVLYLI